MSSITVPKMGPWYESDGTLNCTLKYQDKFEVFKNCPQILNIYWLSLQLVPLPPYFNGIMYLNLVGSVSHFWSVNWIITDLDIEFTFGWSPAIISVPFFFLKWVQGILCVSLVFCWAKSYPIVHPSYKNNMHVTYLLTGYFWRLNLSQWHHMSTMVSWIIGNSMIFSTASSGWQKW